MNKPFALMALTAALSAPAALAATPVMFSSINNFNTPDANQVAGLRVSALHGKVAEVKGVDFSILGLSETNKTTGVNFGFLFGASKVNQEMTGASLGLLNWNTGHTYGANLGLVNLTNDVHGANLSFVNYSQGNTLVDLGAANFSSTSTVQFGLFNKTDKIEGVQIGLINCADNGFFKCFPIINFAK
ncbi:MAG: VC2662 family protein [Vibrio sp.]|uniref:VC2662 family protein n=1 Tax=Vibrio sp. TaxID=678 RepID=UPI003F33DCAF